MDESQRRVEAESLFANWASRVEAGEQLEFDELVRAHAALETELRELHDDWKLFAPILGNVVPGLIASGDGLVLPSLTRGPDADDAPPSDELLDRLGLHMPGDKRYRFRARIGQGGGGVVLKVWDTKLNRPLAMKLVLGRAEDQPTGQTPRVDGRTLTRFVDEARIASQLNHPGIVPVHELGADETGRAFFTMKLVKGEDLSRVFEKVKRGEDGLTLPRAVGYLLRVCEAMAYAHDRGVIHRDLKPANVMVGAYGEVHVMDWGLARVFGAASGAPVAHNRHPTEPVSQVDSLRRAERATTPDSPLATEHGDQIGTPCYMSPEQARGDIGAVGPQSDVYAVGAMLYQLLTGTPPYVPPGQRISALMIVRQTIHGPPPPVESLAPRAIPELVAICERAMAQEPSARYSSMPALAADLQAFLERRVVSAYETGPWAETRQWVRRNKPLTAAIVATVAVSITGAGAALWLARDASAEARRANTNAQRAIANERRALDAEELAHAAAVRASGLAAEAQEQYAIAEAVAAFQARMISAADPYNRLGDKVTVLQAIEGAVAELDKGSLEEQPMVEAGIRATIGRTLKELGRFDDAESNLRRSLAIRRVAASTGDLRTADCLSSLAVVLMEQNRTSEAEPLFREALEIRRAALPSHHPDIGTGLSNLAALLQKQNRVAEAEPLYRDALSIYRAALPAEELNVADCSNNLGILLQAENRVAEAELLYREAIVIYRPHLPDGRPTFARYLNNLASLLYGQHNFAEAESLTREALDLSRAALPVGHPDIAMVQTNLSMLFRVQRRFEEAELLARESLESHRANFPPGHPDISWALNNLASSLRDQGKLADAEPLLREALEIRRSALPVGHPEIAVSLNNLASLLNHGRRFVEAEPLYREALVVHRAGLPTDHPDVAVSLNNLAVCLLEQKRLDEAEPLFHEAVEIARASLPVGHSTRLAPMLGLTELSSIHGRTDKVVALFREEVEASHATLPKNSSELADQLATFGHNLLKIKAWDEAEPLLMECLRIREKSQPDDWRTFSTMSMLGATFLGRQRLAEAEPLILSGYRGMKERESGIPLQAAIRVLDALERLVQLYEAMDNPVEAAAWRIELDAKRSEHSPRVMSDGK